MVWDNETWAKVGAPVVKRAKAEVLSDIAKGTVPETVKSFAELHDYVDANGYGGAFENFDGSDESIAFWNRVQDEVGLWLQKGGHTFKAFAATGFDCSNLGLHLGDSMLEGCKGRLYCDGNLWVEDTSTWKPDAPGYGKGKWYTLIGRAEYQSDKLEDVERPLYQFALTDGYMEEWV